MKLYTRNYGGNLHQTAIFINRDKLADFVLTMDYGDSNTVVVFKVETSLFNELWRQDNRVGNPEDF